jgi:hypothetical protein
MQEYGIWTASDGGFVETGFYGEDGEAAANERLEEYIAEDIDNLSDLSVVEICPDHEEQPKYGCQECEA